MAAASVYFNRDGSPNNQTGKYNIYDLEKIKLQAIVKVNQSYSQYIRCGGVDLGGFAHAADFERSESSQAYVLNNTSSLKQGCSDTQESQEQLIRALDADLKTADQAAEAYRKSSAFLAETGYDDNGGDDDDEKENDDMWDTALLEQKYNHMLEMRRDLDNNLFLLNNNTYSIPTTQLNQTVYLTLVGTTLATILVFGVFYKISM